MLDVGYCDFAPCPKHRYVLDRSRLLLFISLKNIKFWVHTGRKKKKENAQSIFKVLIQQFALLKGFL